MLFGDRNLPDLRHLGRVLLLSSRSLSCVSAAGWLAGWLARSSRALWSSSLTEGSSNRLLLNNKKKEISNLKNPKNV
jgi:hypothetical protein